MDFVNYTVGGTISARENYDSDHPTLKTAINAIRGRVWAQGWRKQRFEEVDRRLAESGWHRHDESYKVERYGKKYGLTGFFEWLGRAEAEGLRRQEWRDGRLPETDLDPSFPAEPSRLPTPLGTWARRTPVDERRWVRHGLIEVPDELLVRSEFGGEGGPWVLVEGNLSSDDAVVARHTFGLLRGLLVASTDAERLKEALRQRTYPGNHWVPEIPSYYYTHAGETTWRSSTPTEGSGQVSSHTAEIAHEDEPSITVELLAVEYAWGSYHSALNRAAGPVPTTRVSEQLQLRSARRSLDRVDLAGRPGSLTFRAPEGFIGTLLYLREDLLRFYAGDDRELVWMLWGERQLRGYSMSWPRWLMNVRQEHADIWRRVRSLDEVDRRRAATLGQE